ncbi:MAG: serine hydrolase domain-containing protein [Acidimicrobiales bacterium]
MPQWLVPFELPRVTPAVAPSSGPWPRGAWPRSATPPALEDLVEEAFCDPAYGETNAVVVVREGAVVAERYGGLRPHLDRPAEPVGPATELLSWSIAKSFLHALVGILVDEGRLDPARRAPVPEWADPTDPRHAITLADLLAMRSGLAFGEVYDVESASDVVEMLFGEARADTAGFAAAKSLVEAPGAVFRYSSGTSNILSRIVADVVGPGEAYRRFIDERLLEPLSMRARPEVDGRGVFVASSFLHASALDFARFGLLYLRGGVVGGRRILSEEWVATAQRPTGRDEESGEYYAWHWWVTGDAHGSYFASGYEGQMIVVAPALDALVLRFGHTPEAAYPALAAWRARVLDALA